MENESWVVGRVGHALQSAWVQLGAVQFQSEDNDVSLCCMCCMCCMQQQQGWSEASIFNVELSIFVPDQKWMKCNATAAAVAVAVAAPVVAVAAAIAAQ